MKIQITIIGLGQIGASIGLALAKKSDTIERIGYDIDPRVLRQASKIGAVDKTSSNLLKVLKSSDAVLLALPTDEIRPMMALITTSGKFIHNTSPDVYTQFYGVSNE